METKTKYSKYNRAKKQVEAIKDFYNHLAAYFFINVGLLLFKSNILGFFGLKGTNDPGFSDWLDWNIIATPLLWGMGLLFHGLYVFKFKSIPLKRLRPKILRDWEKGQIQKFMQEDSAELD